MNWLARLFRNRTMEQQLDRELRFHLESQVADKIDAGMSPAEAHRTTCLEFGGLEQINRQTRESRGTLWLISVGEDLRFGARLLARSPGFALTSTVVLTLGIGVNTLAFSLYNLLTLKSLPIRDPDTLVSVERRSPQNINPGVPWTSILYYRDNARTLSAVIAPSAPPRWPSITTRSTSTPHSSLPTTSPSWRATCRRSPLRSLPRRFTSFAARRHP